MIPRVRPWLVRFMREGKEVAHVKVETVNRRFARWLALEQFPAGYLIGTEVKVTRMRDCPATKPACARNDYSRVS